jgi:hypothetical protein
MKAKITNCLFVLLALSLAGIMIGCGSVPLPDAGPELGEATLLQKALNALPEITVAEKEVKFEFGGDVWIAKAEGKNFLAGTFTSVDNEEGSILTLTQTHIYSAEEKPVVGGEVGWVTTPGLPDIVLEYKKGPPETLAVVEAAAEAEAEPVVEAEPAAEAEAVSE